MLWKVNRDQKILAENLQNTLLVISGQRDESIEIPNDPKNQKWMNAGVYDEETGVFLFRQGEPARVQAHFKLLRLNRLQLKKAVNNF